MVACFSSSRKNQLYISHLPLTRNSLKVTIHLTIIGAHLQTTNVLITYFSPYLATSSLLDSKIFLCILSLCSSLDMKDQVLHPQNKGQITFGFKLNKCCQYNGRRFLTYWSDSSGERAVFYSYTSRSSSQVPLYSSVTQCLILPFRFPTVRKTSLSFLRNTENFHLVPGS